MACTQTHDILLTIAIISSHNDWLKTGGAWSIAIILRLDSFIFEKAGPMSSDFGARCWVALSFTTYELLPLSRIIEISLSITPTSTPDGEKVSILTARGMHGLRL